MRKKTLHALLLFTTFLNILSCGNKKKEESEKDSQQAQNSNSKINATAPYDSLYYYAFKLDSTTIANESRLMDRTLLGNNKHKKIILKFVFYGTATDTVISDLLIYPAKKQANYGEGEAPDTAIRNTVIKLRNPLVMGNNHINWRTISDKIIKKGNLITGFDYLLFVPQDRAQAGCPSCDKQLSYHIFLFKKGDTRTSLFPYGGQDLGFSNPSPPAPPLP